MDCCAGTAPSITWLYQFSMKVRRAPWLFARPEGQISSTRRVTGCRHLTRDAKVPIAQGDVALRHSHCVVTRFTEW